MLSPSPHPGLEQALRASTQSGDIPVRRLFGCMNRCVHERRAAVGYPCRRRRHKKAPGGGRLERRSGNSGSGLTAGIVPVVVVMVVFGVVAFEMMVFMLVGVTGSAVVMLVLVGVTVIAVVMLVLAGVAVIAMVMLMFGLVRLVRGVIGPGRRYGQAQAGDYRQQDRRLACHSLYSLPVTHRDRTFISPKAGREQSLRIPGRDSLAGGRHARSPTAVCERPTRLPSSRQKRSRSVAWRRPGTRSRHHRVWRRRVGHR